MYLSSVDNCSVVRLRTTTHSYVRTRTCVRAYLCVRRRAYTCAVWASL